MIDYFPTIYPDELIYSILSRCCAKSGYLTYKQASEEFFNNPNEKIEFRFINNLKEEVIGYLIKDKSWDKILLDHTMFPYYTRFLHGDKKRLAYEKLKTMQGNYMNLISLTPNRREQEEYLRYCPLCIKEQRIQYGEAYWNRIHQMTESLVCPIHGCRLHNTTITLDRHKTRNFIPLETEIADMTIEWGTVIDIQISKYLNELLHADFSVEDKSEMEEFWISELIGTPYLSPRGQIINLSKLYQDMMEYYQDSEIGIKKEWQLSKVLHGQRINPYEITQLAIFLKIPVNDLLLRNKKNHTRQEHFDNKVIGMLQHGKSAYSIANEFSVSKSLIRLIVKENNIHNESTRKYVSRYITDRETKILEERKFWLSVVEKHSGLSYSQLCENEEYKLRLRWLRRNDKEWTDVHYPVKKK